MKNKKPILILLISAVVLISFFFFSQQKDKKKEVNWLQHYDSNLTDPYGLSVIKELLSTYHPIKKFNRLNEPIHNSLASKKDTSPANFIFIGNNFLLNQQDLDSLCSFVNKGNNAFIASSSISEDLINEIYKGDCGDWYGYNIHSDSSVIMNFSNPQFYDSIAYTFNYKFKNKSVECDWNYISGTYFCDSSKSGIEYLSYVDTFLVNYFRVPYGKGYFLIHSNPLAFTNYQLLNKHNLVYAGKVFSYLNKGNIYWDEYYNLQSDYSPDDERQMSESPLKYILSQPALKWAWYILLLLVFFYLLFHAKRKQKIIPVLETNANTSLRFVKTVGKLYFQQNEPKKISVQKMKLFLFFIRNKYYLPTNVLDDELIKKISIKSTLPLDVVQKIFNKIKVLNIEKYEFSEDEMVEFHQSIDYFYKNCK